MLTGEHTAEFQLRQLLFQHIKLSDGLVKGFFVFGFNGQLQQSGHVLQPLRHLIQRINDGFQRGTLFAQRLCTLWFIPDVGLLQLGVYFFETLFLSIVVKDTP